MGCACPSIVIAVSSAPRGRTIVCWPPRLLRRARSSDASVERRPGLTLSLLRTIVSERHVIRTGGAVLISEYRLWLNSTPELTGAMVRAGTTSDARMQRRLAFYLLELANAA